MRQRRGKYAIFKGIWNTLDLVLLPILLHTEPSVYVYTIPCEFASMEFTLYIDGTVTMSTWMHISK